MDEHGSVSSRVELRGTRLYCPCPSPRSCCSCSPPLDTACRRRAGLCRHPVHRCI